MKVGFQCSENQTGVEIMITYFFSLSMACPTMGSDCKIRTGCDSVRDKGVE